MEHNTELRRRVRKAALIGLAGGLFAVVASGGPSRPAPVDPASLPSPRLAPRRPQQAPKAQAPRPTHATHRGWAIPAGEVDVDRAAVDGRSLVQTVSDGTRLELTLDPMLQRAAKRSLAKYQVDYGVVVALDPKTGALLTLAEHAEGRPELRHLALQAEGPAASVFKVISSAALLEYAGLSPDDRICTRGGHRGLSLAHLRPHATRDRDCQSFAEALGASNNVAFGRWSDQLLKPAQLQAMAERFLFNRRLPFLWGVAVSRARVPTSSRLGFARAAAGFEGTTLSPLHAALLMGAIANGGKMMAPRLVRRASRGDQVVYEASAAELTQAVAPRTADQLLRMMVETTTTGTGRRFFTRNDKPRIPGVAIAGKTGSLSSKDTGVTRHYSWFVAAAPAEHPEIVIASLVVNGAEWRTKGIVPARELLEHYFKRKSLGPGAQ